MKGFNSKSRSQHFTKSKRTDFGQISDIHPAKEVYWICIPIHDKGPLPSASDCFGDYDTSNTQYAFYKHLQDALASCVENGNFGGYTLTVNQNDKRLTRNVLEAIVNFNTRGDDDKLTTGLMKRVKRGRFFSPSVNIALKETADEIKKQRLKQASSIFNNNNMYCYGNMTIIDKTSTVPRQCIASRGLHASKFLDPQTSYEAAEIKELIKTMNLKDSEDIDITSDLINAAQLGNGIENDIMPKFETVMYALPRSMMQSDNQVDDDAENSSTDFLNGEDTMGFQDSENDNMNAHNDLTREALLASAINCSNTMDGTVNSREVGAILFAFVQYDETVKIGDVLESMIANVDQKYISAAQAPSRFTQETPNARTLRILACMSPHDHPVHTISQSLLWDWVRDYQNIPFNAEDSMSAKSKWFVSDRDSPLHPSTWATLSNALAVAQRWGIDEDYLNVNNFVEGYNERLATGVASDVAIRRDDGFIKLNTPQDVVEGCGIQTQETIVNDEQIRSARLEQNEAENIFEFNERNANDTYKPAIDSWVWNGDSFQQFPCRQNRGIDTTIFPFRIASTDSELVINEGVDNPVLLQESSSSSFNVNLADSFVNNIEITPELRERYDDAGIFSDTVIRMKIATARHMNDFERKVEEVERSGGAPFENDDVMIDNYYRHKTLEKEVAKYFTHPDKNAEKYAIWRKKYKQYATVTNGWVRDSLLPSARTNKYCKIVINYLRNLQAKGSKTLTSTTFICDPGKPLHWNRRRVTDREGLPMTKNGLPMVVLPDGSYGVIDQTIRDPEHPGIDAFAQYNLRFMQSLRKNIGVEDPLMVLYANHALSSCYFYKPGRPLLLLVISAPAGEGKTYVLMVLESLSIPGTTRKENHVSDMAVTAMHDVDVAILTDEAKGILQKKKDASVNSTELGKAMLAGTGTVSTMRAAYTQDPLTGKKHLGVEESEMAHSKSYVVGTNAKAEEIDENMLPRTIWFNKPKSFTLASGLSWKNFQEFDAATKQSNRVMQLCQFFIYKGIQQGAIPSFDNMPSVNMIFTMMGKYLDDMGIHAMEGHHANRTHGKIKQFIVDDMLKWAISSAINTPGGVCYGDSIELNLWSRISPLLYPTLQVILWNIMALRDMWVPSEISHVIIAMLKVGNYEWTENSNAAQICAEDTDGRITWKKTLRYENKPNNNGNDTDQFNRPEKVWLNDINYIAVTPTESYWQLVSDAMPAHVRKPPSWIKSVIYSTATKQTFSPPGGKFNLLSEDDMTDLRSVPGKWKTLVMGKIDAGKKLPLIIMTDDVSGRKKRLYIPTGAAKILQRDVLLEAFLKATTSGKSHPHKWIIPKPHHKYRDIMGTIELTASRRDAIVEAIDKGIKETYDQKLAYRIEHGLPCGSDFDKISDRRKSRKSDNATAFTFDDGLEDSNDGIEEGGIIPDQTVYVESTTGYRWEWWYDSKILSRKYGIANEDNSQISRSDALIALQTGQEYNPKLNARWDQAREAIMENRRSGIKVIKMDYDDYSARERWILSALPLETKEGVKIPVLSPVECERRMHEYLQANDIVPETLNFPKELIQEREHQAVTGHILSSTSHIKIPMKDIVSNDVFRYEKTNDDNNNNNNNYNRNVSNDNSGSDNNNNNIDYTRHRRRANHGVHTIFGAQ